MLRLVERCMLPALAEDVTCCGLAFLLGLTIEILDRLSRPRLRINRCRSPLRDEAHGWPLHLLRIVALGAELRSLQWRLDGLEQARGHGRGAIPATSGDTGALGFFNTFTKGIYPINLILNILCPEAQFHEPRVHSNVTVAVAHLLRQQLGNRHVHLAECLAFVFFVGEC